MTDFLHVAYITGMFHKGCVEHKLTRNGTAVNVPRDVPQAGNHEYAAKVSAKPSHRMIQTIALNIRMTHHARPCEQRADEQCSHEQHEARHGGGVDTGDDHNTAIHKSAKQKMPKWGSTYYWRFAVGFGVSGLRYEVVDMRCDLCSFALNFLDVGEV